MKFLNKVIVFVMGVVVIGIVSTALGVVIHDGEKSVTFELLENGQLAPNIYNNLIDYAVYDTNGEVINLVNVFVNGDSSDFTEPTMIYIEGIQIIITDNVDDIPEVYITNDNTYTSVLDVGDVIVVTFDVGQETPAIIKTLLFLIPLVLSASLIGFLAFKKGVE